MYSVFTLQHYDFLQTVNGILSECKKENEIKKATRRIIQNIYCTLNPVNSRFMFQNSGAHPLHKLF